MARFFDPKGAESGQDMRLHAPATARNRDVLFDVLAPALKKAGVLVEVASGTGEHAAHMAPKLPNHVWQPTDIEDHHLQSIDGWRLHVETPNILPAQRFDVLADDFTVLHSKEELSAILAVNLIHIAPWAVTEALMEKAGAALTPGATFFLYGPYKCDGIHTSVSNEAFDHSLKTNNSAWGVRDMEDVVSLACSVGFDEPTVTAMPANNFSLIFEKQ